jgi:hypothetical protein
MSLFAILSNLSTILGLVHTVEGLVGNIVTTKKPPTFSDLLPLIDEVEAIFKSGVIQIKGVDDKQVADALHMVRDQLTKLPLT